MAVETTQGLRDQVVIPHLSVETPLCPYSIVCRRACGSSTSGPFRKISVFRCVALPFAYTSLESWLAMAVETAQGLRDRVLNLTFYLRL